MAESYVPPTVKNSVPEASTAGVRYAGFWVRLSATLIDSTLIAFITTPLLLYIYGLDSALSDSMNLLSATPTELLIGWLKPRGPADLIISWVLPAIAVLLFWRYRQATPGKMMLSMKIVDAHTLGPPSTSQNLVRYFSYLVSMLGLCLGFLWIAFDPRKQSWHDKLARTVVIRT